MQKINVPGVGPVNFPDDMSDEDITRAIETEIIPGYQPSVEPAAPVEEKGGFWDAGSAGIDLLQGSLASARQGFNRIVGDDEEADSLQAYIDQQAAEREEALPGGPQMFTEAKTAGDYWDAFKEGAGYSLPLSGPALIGGMIGGAKYGAGLGSFFGPAGAFLGGIGGTVIGGIIAGTIPFYGLNRERQKEVLGEVQSEAKALGAAIPQAGMDALLSKIIPGIGTGWTGNILTRTLKGTGAGATTEAPTEMLQQVLERWQAGLDLDSEDAIAEYKEAVIAGFALGAGFGGATGPFNTPRAEQDAGDAPPSPERSFLEQRAKERRDQYDQRQQEKEAARTQAEEGAVQAEEADAVVAEEAEAAAAQERGRITPEGYIGPEGQLPAPPPPPKWSPEPVLTEEAEAEVAAAPKSLFDISYLPESQQAEVVEERAKMAADGQRKKILADPSEPVFEAADLGSYGAQVANYFAIRQPGKTTYSVQDLRDAGIHKGALDLIASQKDGAPQRYGIEADENYINFGKALAKAKGYGTSSQPWKRLVKQFTGKDSSQSLNVSDLKSLVEGIQSLPNNNAESRAAKKADREQVEAADRDALFEDSYSKAMSFLKTAQIADKAALTASPQEGGLGLPSGEAQKLLDAGVNRGDLREMGVDRLNEQTQYAFNDKTGTPREISTPQEPQEGQTQQLRVKEIGVRKGPYDEGGDGWTFEIDGTPGPMFETRDAAKAAGEKTAKARGARAPIPFRGRREFAVVQDVLDADGQRASTAPVQTFPSFEEALGYAEQQGIDIDESTIADAEARRAAALDAAPEPEPAPEKTVEQRKQEIRARIEQNRETNREARLRMEALNKVDGGLTIPRTEMGEIRSALTARLQELNIPNVKIIAQNFINDGSNIEFGGKFENGTIFLSLHAFRTGDRNEVDMNKLIGTLNHEVIHALKENGIITAKQWDALIRASKKQKTDGVTFWQREIDRQAIFARDDAAAGIVRSPEEQARLDEGGDIFMEEVVAEMFRIWAANDGKFPGTPASIFRKILNFIEALGNAFRGRGYMTADSVFKGIDTGAAGRQAPRTAPVTGSLEDVGYDEFTMDEYQPGRMSRTDQQMYEFKIRRVGKDSVTRRVIATSPQEARRKAIEQMKRTKKGFEVVDIKLWSSLAEEVRKDFDAKLPDEAKNGNRYSRRMVADMTNVESQAEFDAWFEGAELQDKNGNPIILYRGTRGSVTDETGRAVPSPEIRINDQGMSFFSFDPKFTEMFSQPEFEPDPVPEGKIGAPPPYIRLDGDLEVELPRTIPVIINSKKLFNPDTEAQWKQLREYADDKEAFDAAKAAYDAQVREQQEYGEPKDTWYRIENAPSIMDAIRKSPFDSLFLWEDGYRNVAVFDAKQVKSVFNKFEPGAASSSRYSRVPSKMVDFIRQNPDGFTLEVDGETVPQKGFVLAPVKQTEIILNSEDINESTADRLYEVIDALSLAQGEKAIAGGWLKGGQYWLDASKVYDNYEDAVYIAEAGDQIGFFDLGELNVIDTQEAVRQLKESGVYDDRRFDDARRAGERLAQRFAEERTDLRRKSARETLEAGERLRSLQLARPFENRRAGEAELGAAQEAFAPLEGIEPGALGPNLELRKVAEDYAASVGLPYTRQKVYAPVDPREGEAVAAAYDNMKHAPENPAVQKSFRDMIDQTLAQYQFLKDAGYKFYFMDPNNDPYNGVPRQALEELLVNRTMAVFPTSAGYGDEIGASSSDNPLLEMTNEYLPDQDGKLIQATANDIFRIVHDALGHGPEGTAFRGRGEDNAWIHHSRLYYGDALRAMTSETRGQNSWLNYGPYGEKNKTASVENTVFAEQKIGLMPDWTLRKASRFSRISPRNPTAVSRTEDPAGGRLQIGASHVLDNDSKNREKIVQILKTYPGFKTTKRNPEAVVEEFKNFVKDNLLFIFDNVPPETRKRSKLWYEGARKIVDDWSAKYNLPPAQIAAVLAALSPQKDWYQNVSLAERVLDIHTQFTRGNTKAWMPPAEMLQRGEQLYLMNDKGKPKTDKMSVQRRGYIKGILSKPYMDIKHDDPAVQRDMQAIWVRTYDQTYNNRGYRTVTPEGLFVGEPAGVAAWGSNSELGKALGVLSGGDLNAISDMMGLQHKVRSFFNNIIDPNSLDGDVTIDTHAVAAALLRALSQSSKEVAQAFGSSLDKDKQPSDWLSPPGSTVTGAKGLYGIYADAYREAAAARGVLPREMQSITWEAIRGLFPKKWKQPENVKAIDNIWREYEAGDIGLGDARQKIIQTAGNIDEPTWKRDELPSTAGAEGVASSSYAGELSGGGVSGRYSRGLRSDGRGGPSGAPQGPGLVQAPNGTTSFGGFVLPGSSKVAPVQMNSGAVNHIKKARFHNNSDAEDFSHLENFIKYSPVGNMRQVGVLLEEMLKAYQANPNAREFKVKRSPDRDSRYVLEWYSPAFKTRNKTVRLVLEAKPTPVGTVMDVVTFFLDIPTYSMNGPREQKYSRVPNGGPQAINDGFADQAFADAEGIVGRFIKKVGRSATAREIRERLQDKYIEVQEWLTNYHDQLKLQGKTMTDRENFFMQENNMHGQRGNMQSHQKLNVYAPIMKRIGEMGVTMEDLGQYMFAMNAEEKNAYIESIGGRPGGSGVLDAAKYKADTLKKFQDAGTLSNIQAAATLARKIIENTNEIYLRAGLISPEQKAAGDAAMPNYVPSRGKVENDLDPDVMSIGGSAHGKGYNVRGAENMRLTGREDIPPLDEIMTNIVAQNINAINRAYKNKVARSFYELAKSNPNDPTIQIIDETNKRDYFVEVANVNGKIIKRVDPRWKDHPEMFWVKVRGQDVGIHFPGSERMVRALRHADTPTNIGPVYKFLLGFNRYLASVNTSWNPDFILSNLLKDMQQAGIVSNQVGGKFIAAKILKDVPAAILGVREVLRGGTTNSEFAKEFADMRRAGGTTEYLGVTDMDLTSKKLKQELEEFSGGGVGKSRKVLRSVVNFIEDYNRVAENATRLAAYVNAKKMGATKDQAAYLAKNLTVNFDRGGTYKAQANALFLFYNAALQGSHVILNSVARSKKVQGVMAGVIGAGFTSDLVNAMFFSEEDDDGILLYDKLPDYVLQSRMVFMGNKSDAAEPYFGIPMPYGFNAFFNLGRVMSKLTRGGYNNSWDAAGDAAYPMIDAFNPLGGTNSFLNFVSPTILDLGVDLESNKDFAGRDIVPESGNPFAKYEQPDSQKYWNSTAKPFVGMASFMNSLFGGSEWEKGPLDYSPEQIEYVYDYALGGAGKFALRVAQLPGTVNNIIADDWAEVRVNQIPFVRNFMGNVGNQEDVQLYIENSTDVMTQLNKLDGLKELKRPELVRQHLAEKGDEIRLAKYFTNVDKQLRKIRNMEKQLRAHEGLSDEMKKKQLRKYRDMKMSLMENANGLYKSMKDRD